MNSEEGEDREDEKVTESLLNSPTMKEMEGNCVEMQDLSTSQSEKL